MTLILISTVRKFFRNHFFFSLTQYATSQLRKFYATQKKYRITIVSRCFSLRTERKTKFEMFHTFLDEKCKFSQSQPLSQIFKYFF